MADLRLLTRPHVFAPRRVNQVVPAGGTTLTFATPVAAADAPTVGDLLLFGEMGLESRRLICKRMRRRGEYSARVEFIDEAPEIHDADSAALPPPAVLSTGPATPPLPAAVVDLALTEIVDYVAGRPVVRVAAAWRPGNGSAVAGYEVYLRQGGSWRLQDVVTAPRVRLGPFGVGETVEVAVSAVSPSGLKLPVGQAASASLTTVGDVSIPPDVARLMVEDAAGGRRRFWWTIDTAMPDLAGVLLRYNHGHSRDWGRASPLHEGVLPAPPFETDALRYGTATVLAKAVDTSGNLSGGVAVAVLNLGDPLSQNLVYTVDYGDGGWAGTKVGASVDGDDLLADDPGTPMYTDGAALMYGGDDSAPRYGSPSDPAYASDWIAMYAGDDQPMYEAIYSELRYRDTITPDAAGLLHLDVAGDGDIRLRYRARWPDAMYVAAAGPMYGEDAALMYRESTAYLPWTGRVHAVEQEYEIEAEIPADTVRGRLARLVAQVDAEDIIERFDDLAIDAGGTRLPVTKPFRVIRNVQLTLQDDAGSAERLKLLDKSLSGPLVRAFDGAGAGAAATIDATVQGY
ncbi:MAG: hypothetical protein WD270_05495 [Acetobacterales bacterium]